MRLKLFILAAWWLVPLLAGAAPAPAANDLRLVEAVKNQNKEDVRALLKQKVDVKATQPDGATALHWAVQWDDLETTDLLIRAGADVDHANDHGITPLWLACVNGNESIITSLLKAGANANAVFPTGETPLMLAARTGKVEAVAALLNKGADTKAQEPSRGQNALMWAAGEGHIEVVRFLIERGADVHARSKAGFTPFLYAARRNDLDLIRLFLGTGADVNEAATDGTTALLIATVRGNIAIAKFLVEHGADTNKGAGFTPLHWAAGEWSGGDVVEDKTVSVGNDEWSSLEGLRGEKQVEFVKYLLAHGADVNARAAGNIPRYGAGRARGGTLAGATPFLLAAKYGDAEIMRVLADHGADPLLSTERGTTPLIVAAGVGAHGPIGVSERDAFEAVKLCVELGIDVNAVDSSGDTALHGASYRGITGSKSIIRFLVEKGAKLNVVDKFGWTPLAIVEGIYWGGADTRSDDTAELYRQLGAEPTSPDIERDGNIAELKAQIDTGFSNRLVPTPAAGAAPR